MRYCNHCHKLTTGEALFCNFCGRTYDLKLCPSRHTNPRNAELCRTCGSRELSAPHPRVSVMLLPLVWLLTGIPGVLLALVSLALVYGTLLSAAENPQILARAGAAALMLVALWSLYMRLPNVLRRLITKLFRGTGSDNHHDH